MRSSDSDLVSVRPRLLVCLFLSSGATAAALGDRFQLYGYGSQDYLQASRNTCLGADDRGSWDVNFIGLVGVVTSAILRNIYFKYI
jgi:hypothetical protein